MDQLDPVARLGVAAALAALGLAAGCTQPMGHDAGASPSIDGAIDGAVDGAVDGAIDGAIDGGTSDAGADSGSRPDGGPPTVRVVGSIVSIGGPTVSGGLLVVDQGFERSGLVCAGTTCVVGGMEP